MSGEIPVSSAKHDEIAHVAIAIGILAALILLLAVAVFLVVSRHRQRKCFASPVNGKPPSHLGSTCATVEKGAALMAYTLEDDERYELVLVDDRSELIKVKNHGKRFNNHSNDTMTNPKF